MKNKILAIKQDIENIISPICLEKFWIDWYGAYDVNPKHLVFWICLISDKMKTEFKSNTELLTRLRDLLAIHDYPEQARQSVFIDFESQETVDRESDGNWYHHFK
jgi:hypothetical protein